MVRVIAGTAGGRKLKAVPGRTTRPTSDKVKESMFNMIGPYFDGGIVLDLFAGTGGLSIEAISRGMDRAVLVDKEKASIETIYDNVKAVGMEGQVEVFRADAFRAVKALFKRQLCFDLVLLDPPYRMKDMDQWVVVMQEGGLLQPHAIIVLEHDAAHSYPESVGQFHCYRSNQYGDIAITLYRQQTS